jgi:hypothetical protein
MLTARYAACLWLAFTGALLLPAAEQPGSVGQPLKFDLTGDVMDGPNLAYSMMRTFLTDQEWQQRVADCRKRFETWEHDNHGDMGQFLNDRLIIVALSAAGGDVKEVQRGVAYLALYKEFQQIPPGLVLNFLREHKESVTELISNFTWDKASEYVKAKRWREDIAKRKAKARQDREQAKAKENTPDQTGAVATTPPPQPVREVVTTVTPVQTAEVTPASTPVPEAQVVTPAALQVMSLKWDVLTEPFMAETPLHSK